MTTDNNYTLSQKNRTLDLSR